MSLPQNPTSPTAIPWLALLAVTAIASTVLFWRLDDRHLWQDEATIAVLGERLLTYGKPLAYDGRNLITMDTYRPDEFKQGQVPTANADAAVRFFAQRGDFKDDTTWIRHPWGAFVLAGLSLEVLGRGTLQARLPFALSAVLAAVLLWWFVRKRFGDWLMASVALMLCLGNVYWLLHMRQCHYNAPSCLMLLVTLAAYLRWQEGKRFGGTGFVVASCLWFHFDYGSVWPALAVLYADAVRSAWPRIWRPTKVGLAFGITTAPFVFYYELLGRSAFGASQDHLRLFSENVFYVNQFLVPLLLLVPMGWLLWRQRGKMPPGQARVLGLCAAISAATVLWLPWVVPMTFYRYLVHLTPLVALLQAWLLVRLAEKSVLRSSVPVWLSTAVLTVFLIIVPLPASLFSWAFPKELRARIETGTWARPELFRYLEEMSGTLPDPGGEVIRAIQQRIEEGDEILVNYEDRPFVFYTNARVRGGIPAFRVNDPSSGPPRFLVFRNSVAFTYNRLFIAEAKKYSWRPIPVNAADIPWSNIPDPRFRRLLFDEGRSDVPVFERVPDVGYETDPGVRRQR
jgi:hypothetical protein